MKNFERKGPLIHEKKERIKNKTGSKVIIQIIEQNYHQGLFAKNDWWRSEER